MTASSPQRTASALFNERRAGVLLHPTSLLSSAPGDGLQAAALRFLDFLAEEIGSQRKLLEGQGQALLPKSEGIAGQA